METRNKAERINRIEIGTMDIHDPGADFVISNAAPIRGFDLEMIEDFLLAADHRGFIIIKPIVIEKTRVIIITIKTVSILTTPHNILL